LRAGRCPGWPAGCWRWPWPSPAAGPLAWPRWAPRRRARPPWCSWPGGGLGASPATCWGPPRSSARPPACSRWPCDDGTDVAGRAALPALVGRDPAGMDEAEMARAVVESVAENTVDAVVAPAFWAAVGGAPGALAYRAVNTMDAMVGHRSPRYQAYGWASARLDDAAGYLPARLTA